MERPKRMQDIASHIKRIPPIRYKYGGCAAANSFTAAAAFLLTSEPHPLRRDATKSWLEIYACVIWFYHHPRHPYFRGAVKLKNLWC